MKTSIGLNERPQPRINGHDYSVIMQLPEEEFKPFISMLADVAIANNGYAHQLLMQVSQLIIRIKNGKNDREEEMLSL